MSTMKPDVIRIVGDARAVQSVRTLHRAALLKSARLRSTGDGHMASPMTSVANHIFEKVLCREAQIFTRGDRRSRQKFANRASDARRWAGRERAASRRPQDQGSGRARAPLGCDAACRIPLTLCSPCKITIPTKALRMRSFACGQPTARPGRTGRERARTCLEKP